MTLARVLCAAAGLSLSATAAADTITLDFESLVHGELVTNQFDSLGVTMSATNFQLAGVMPAAFDTNMSGTADPDLEGPNWAGGNLSGPGNPRGGGGVDLGVAIIIPENLRDNNNDGLLDDPDDEGSRPAGTLTFAFDDPRTGFGFDVIDLESIASEGSSLDFFSANALIGSVSFSDFTDPNSMFFDSSLDFGNNTANRISPIMISDVTGGSASTFDTVVINVGGSGAYDNIVAVPSPASAGLLALAGLAGMGRRRR